MFTVKHLIGKDASSREESCFGGESEAIHKADSLTHSLTQLSEDPKRPNFFLLGATKEAMYSNLKKKKVEKSPGFSTHNFSKLHNRRGYKGFSGTLHDVH